MNSSKSSMMYSLIPLARGYKIVSVMRRWIAALYQFAFKCIPSLSLRRSPRRTHSTPASAPRCRLGLHLECKLVLILLSAFMLPGLASGDVYYWVDEKGVQYYTTRLESIPEPYR